MNIIKPVLEATFIRRPNRFQGYILLDNEEMMVHVPNTGRCKEILIPGTTVILRQEDAPERKTKYDLISAYKGDKLISIDSHIPNKVVEEALIYKKIPSLVRYTKIMREKTFGNSRFDFKLSDEQENEYYLEVKGVTLESNGIASFPDAPTERGRKHLLELVEAKKQGKGAGVIFLIQIDDIKAFTPHDETDPEFGAALRYAANNGVDVFAYCSEVTKDSITLKKEVQVIL
jgi:sugar fermentation stimulation protein A